MSDSLAADRRFYPWNIIKHRHAQDYAIIKDRGIERVDVERPWASSKKSLDDEWAAIRHLVSATLLHESVMVDPDIRGGVPVLRGTRISLSQILVEISDGETVDGFADEYDIDATVIKKFFDGLAMHLDRSFTK